MSEIKVNKISPRTNCGTTTLGDSGDTFTIPAGVSITNSGTASGFGATGSASWNTTVKTGDFTAVAGEGYFVNTTSGEIDVALPAGTAGAVVAVADYANNFDTNNCILKQNGSDKIEGSTDDAVLNVQGSAITLVFVDSTKGWIVTDSGNSDDASGALFVAATGGTITTVCTNYKVHTFTGPGTFTVSSAGNSLGSNTVDYLVVAAGGGGGGGLGGGGGAGGYRESGGTASGCYTVSPLGSSPSPVAALPVSVQGYSITVGGGGAGRTSPNGTGVAGNPAVFSTITSTGGGGGGTVGTPPVNAGASGGSGGGGGGQNPGPNAGAGNTPPVSPPQGNPGGVADPSPGYFGGGGGGATAAGNSGLPSNPTIAQGGAGGTSSINGTPTARAGGGGGGGDGPSKPGGAGGGGGGGANPEGTGSVGTANTGGGGGGGSGGGPTGGDGAQGGSGIVIIRYKFQ